jgi:hypothetical protein
MLLEDGTRIEGPASEVLAVLFGVQVALLQELTMPPAAAMSAAEVQTARIHDALARAGYVVRQVE